MIEFIRDNWVGIGAAILAVVRVLEAVVELTPSEKDDVIVAKIAAVVRNFFSLSTGN